MESGARYVVEYAWDRSGNAAGLEYLERLLSSRKTEDLAADGLVRVETFAATGELDIPRELNRLTDDLHEIKARTLRLPFYYPVAACAQVRITHGFVKRSEKTPRKEIDLGMAIIREDQNR